MSYPDVRYTGEGGEVTAWRRPADAPPELDLGRVQAHYLATGDRTDGLYGLYRWEMGPTPGGAAPHFHRRFSESFHVLSGRVHLFDGEAWVEGVPGDFVHVPPGGLHGFDNRSGEPASLLILFVPGAPREAYFEGLPDLADMTDEQRARFLDEHDNHDV